MNKWLLIVIMAICSMAAAQNADDILGRQFFRTDNKAIVTFCRQNDSMYCARTTWLQEPNDKYGKPRTDKYNPNDKLKSRPLMNMAVMYNLLYKNGVYTGTAYHPAHGLTCKVKLWMDNSGNMSITGYKWGIHRTETWKKVE